MDATGQAPRVRVLEVCGRAAGGVRAHVLHCARLLAGQGHDVIVEAPAAVLDGAEELLGSARAEALEIGSRPTPGDALAVARLRRLGRRADVVHAHGLRAGALAGLALGGREGRRRRGGARLVVTLHNLPVGSPAVCMVGEYLERVVARRADVVLAVSPDLAERVRRRGARQVSIAVVPAPARPADSAGPADPAAADTAETGALPWPEGAARVLTVARLAPQKGLDLLADAAALVSSALREDGGGRDGGPARLVWALAGEGPERSHLAERIAAEDLPVVLAGRSEQVRELMRQADVVVQTSLWEGQPLAVQEALQEGAALVATDVGGTALTARGGAVLVAPEAPAVADAVLRLLLDPQALARARASSARAGARLPGEEELAAQLAEVLLAG